MRVEVSEVVKWAQEYGGARFHACLCDPPYELGFMGKAWDRSRVAFRPQTWQAIGDCLLPGAMLLAFGGTRTWHRLACAIEDAGFEIRDTIMWVYSSGFPKSHDVSKAIDREAGAEREVVKYSDRKNGPNGFCGGDTVPPVTTPATEAAKQWEGYGTALKPAWEPVIVARKPLEGTVAENCVEYGSGALWIEGGRVEETDGGYERIGYMDDKRSGNYLKGHGKRREDLGIITRSCQPAGRWPANVIHDGSEEVVGLFPETKSGDLNGKPRGNNKWFRLAGDNQNREGDSGSAARFFYCAKASKSEREAGCEGMEGTGKQRDESRNANQLSMNGGGENPYNRGVVVVHNHHPTVKPIALTEYLARLILPPLAYAPRRLLVPFAGSGSEMIGGHRAGWEEIMGIEMNEEYAEIAEARLRHWTRQMVMGV